MAAFLGDTSEIRRALAGDSILGFAPFYVVFYALDNPLDLRGTEEIYPKAYAQSPTAGERHGVEHIWNHYELIRVARAGPRRCPGASDLERLGFEVLSALFADGDSVRGFAAARALQSQLGKPVPGGDYDEMLARYAIGQYGLASGRVELARRAVADLRSTRVDPDSAWQVEVSVPMDSCSKPSWRPLSGSRTRATSCASLIRCLPIR